MAKLADSVSVLNSLALALLIVASGSAHGASSIRPPVTLTRSVHPVIQNGAPVTEKTEDETWRSVVTLNMEKNGEASACTAAIIAPDAILTAGHCVDDSPDGIYVLFKNWQTSEVTRNRIVVRPIIFNPHLHMNMFQLAWDKLTSTFGSKARGDLAILMFKEALPQGFKPMQINDGLLRLKPNSASAGRIFGYGANPDIRQIYGQERLYYIDLSIFPMANSGVLLLETQGNQRICLGDSGSPIIAYRDQTPVLVGVFSRGTIDKSEPCFISSLALNIQYPISFKDKSGRNWIESALAAGRSYMRRTN